MVVNDAACLLTKRSALESIASELAPTESLTEQHYDMFGAFVFVPKKAFKPTVIFDGLRLQLFDPQMPHKCYVAQGRFTASASKGSRGTSAVLTCRSSSGFGLPGVGQLIGNCQPYEPPRHDH